MSGAKGIGIPVKLLHEAAGHVVTVRRKKEGARGKRDSSIGAVPPVDQFVLLQSIARL